ncbi:hypothetical protein Mal4_29200 [Maioricimonas rarisocia]|uniref:Lactonase, 7-bladed beta-propeller n=1 Tax=Maioricimonas rarisocia TaxID=2528026 RepID=A0A517Z828_9PLAN|nr:hypothetical protein [Maioricimonas rarisocia]QDU38591.1 hypothetical protein Mal4_29200 [Maioricimonas rarisocia]
MSFRHVACTLAAAAALIAGSIEAADQYGLSKGTPDLQSAGPLAFGPAGILFIGDTKGATVYAVRTGETSGDPSSVDVSIEGVNVKVAEQLGVNSQDLQINDLVVNPASGTVYVSVSRGAPSAGPAIVRIDADGTISEMSLENVPFAKAELPNPPEDKEVQRGRRRANYRESSITDLAYVDGQLLISGMVASEASSAVRSLSFPFSDRDVASSLEIYHGAHGRVEDDSPARTFVPINIGGEPNVLAGFVCTPLVRFPVSAIGQGEKVRGTTVAELGNRNRPLDMIVYKKEGKDYLLLTNSARGVMKIPTEGIESQEGITERVGGGGTAGQPYETVEELAGVVQLDKLNDTHAVIITETDGGTLNLKTIELP